MAQDRRGRVRRNEGRCDSARCGMAFRQRSGPAGSDWFREPWYHKYAPVPNKAAIPCMTLSKDGTAIGLAWNPVKWATRWFKLPKAFRTAGLCGAEFRRQNG